MTDRHADASAANAAEPDITPLERCVGLAARTLDAPPAGEREPRETSLPVVSLRTLQAMENLNYSSDALQKVFGKYFTTKEEADAFARNPEKIANRVYANRMISSQVVRDSSQNQPVSWLHALVIKNWTSGIANGGAWLRLYLESTEPRRGKASNRKPDVDSYPDLGEFLAGRLRATSGLVSFLKSGRQPATRRLERFFGLAVHRSVPLSHVRLIGGQYLVGKITC